ncbi:hypothetical protein CAPTEDRAFT_218357 [Capitella teleta]|uniref:HIT domain-containing protein n=1 Tax=Capitella teleta TaxID=283909 RepID=R7UK48_CAPTE|nr:hypothetical protein CAPTEDRAFT_218357 [Capitella teleta]|eukprot:ELU06924.1 hypothetical protein CAPTEDRAFT_218357 [Capitella teleta]
MTPDIGKYMYYSLTPRQQLFSLISIIAIVVITVGSFVTHSRGASPPAPLEAALTLRKVIEGKSPANILHDDNRCMAIASNNPLAPVHFLVIPKKCIDNLSFINDTDRALMGHMILVASQVAKRQGIDGFYRLVISNDITTMQHLHIHILGGEGWLGLEDDTLAKC